MFGVTGSSRACADNVINPAVHDIVSLEVVCTPGFMLGSKLLVTDIAGCRDARSYSDST